MNNQIKDQIKCPSCGSYIVSTINPPLATSKFLMLMGFLLTSFLVTAVVGIPMMIIGVLMYFGCKSQPTELTKKGCRTCGYYFMVDSKNNIIGEDGRNEDDFDKSVEKLNQKLSFRYSHRDRRR